MMISPLTIEAIVDLFALRGVHRYGEAVSQTSHALQCAALAQAAGDPDSLVIAALLHDLGHLFDEEFVTEQPDYDDRHEVTGSARLAELFGPAVVQPIALHVAAKRYLCARDPDYYAGLSPASRHSLDLQGGPFAADQVSRFETLPYWAEAVTLRRYDDLGKVLAEPEGSIAAYVPMMRSLAKGG